MFHYNFVGNHPQGQPDEGGDDEEVVELADDGNEIWEEIEGEQEVADGEAEESFGEPGGAGVGDDLAVEVEFLLDAFGKLF